MGHVSSGLPSGTEACSVIDPRSARAREWPVGAREKARDRDLAHAEIAAAISQIAEACMPGLSHRPAGAKPAGRSLGSVVVAVVVAGRAGTGIGRSRGRRPRSRPFVRRTRRAEVIAALVDEAANFVEAPRPEAE